MLQRCAGWLLALTILLGGCAAPVQKPLELPADYFGAKARSGRIGVVVAQLPKPDTAFPGAGCLLCLGVASMAHSALTTHVQTLGVEEFKPLKVELVALLKKQGVEAVAIDDVVAFNDLPDFKGGDAATSSRKDFSAFKGKHQVERLLVVNITALGVWRSYSSYVPTAVPRAVVAGQGFLVDLSTHALEWNLPIDISRAADGAWDEAPKFPGLTNAYFQAVEASLDVIRKPFTK